MVNVKIGDRIAAHEGSCLIAAEIGINHNRDMELAKCMICAAAGSGADAVNSLEYDNEN